MGLARSIARYRQPDGSLTSGGAERLSADVVAQYASAYARRVPAGWFVGMARNESGFAKNEVDTDFNEDDSIRAETFGLFQIGRKEMADMGYGDNAEALLEPAFSCQVFSDLCESRLQRILDAAGMSIVTNDVLRYLAYAHNYGIGDCLSSIGIDGIDWEAFKARVQRDWAERNRTHFLTKLVPYAERAVDAAGEYAGTPGEQFAAEVGGEVAGGVAGAGVVGAFAAMFGGC